MAAQPIYQALVLYLPLLSFLFFVILFRVGIAENIPIVVVDNDRTPLSRKVIAMIDATPAAMVAFETGSSLKAQTLMRSGKASATVVIEDGFQRSILSGDNTRIGNYISGVNISANGQLSKDIGMAVATFSAGIGIEKLTANGIAPERALELIMPIRIEQHSLFNPFTNYGYYLAPSFMAMMLVIFTLCATIFTIGVELKNSTASEWLATANNSPLIAVIGKLAPITLIMTAMAIVMLIIMIEGIGVPMNGSLRMLLIGTILLIVAYESIGVMLIALLSDMRLALSLGGGYGVMAFTFSGLTFPIMAMYPTMQYASRLFPFTYYTQLLTDQSMRGASAADSIPELCYMTLFVLLIPATLPRIGHVCRKSKYWGRL